ncbi:MAG: type II secretion system protein GspD [Micavibrio sp.]
MGHKKAGEKFILKGRVRRALVLASFLLVGCASADIPDARNANIPNPTFAEKRRQAVNERPDSVMYLPLGRDVLLPEVAGDDPLPEVTVGPFELRGETLAGALQLILADYDVPLAFETDEGLTKTISVANLRGPLSAVVRQVCGLAELYCAFQDGILVVKETQTFTVKIPPISQDAAFMQNVASGLQAIVGTAPIIDQSTRTIIYQASQRDADMAVRYFQRMRSSTALIVFETYIWEVSLTSGNSTGVNWGMLESLGKFETGINITGSIGPNFTNPISIGIPTTKNVQGADGELSASEVFEFLSQFGAVKTISQPQITVLSGSEATLRAADRENYVSNISETLDNGQSSTSVSTDSVDTGFTLTIQSAWDNATVYADIEISLTDVLEIENFDFQTSAGGSTTIQLPKTTEREVTTQVRIRPGDSLLIAGLVRENDTYDSSGPGFMKPVLPTSRTVEAGNLELVFLMRPRVIVYANQDDEKHYNAVRNIPPENMPVEEIVSTTPLMMNDIPLEQEPLMPMNAPALEESPVSSIPTDLLDPSFTSSTSQTPQYR